MTDEVKLMSNRTYRVGQVLYVLMSKETKIVPVQIIEEIIKRTVSGESISYIVKAGKNDKSVSLQDLDGEVFDNVELLRETLTKKVMNTVNVVIDNAITRASEWYDQPEVVSPLADVSQVTSEDTVAVKLPDGKIANVKLPSMG